MQFQQCIERTQLPLFHSTALNAQPLTVVEPQEYIREVVADSFSELAVQGSTDNCLLLLGPILRDLSGQTGGRWLTLINAPAQLKAWLRSADLKRDTILLLHAHSANTPLELACEALRLGRSHTVISWINPLESHSRKMLTLAALQGQSQSLNIRLG